MLRTSHRTAFALALFVVASVILVGIAPQVAGQAGTAAFPSGERRVAELQRRRQGQPVFAPRSDQRVQFQQARRSRGI